MTTKDKIREWISDNLRYMLLIGAILLIVAAVLLIVHLVCEMLNMLLGDGLPVVASLTKPRPFIYSWKVL